ncbi:hypothetical protein TELCIR_21006, partial [Teladorsagia circumcincta]
LRDEEKRVEQVMEGRVRVLENMRCNMADEAWRWYQANRDRFQHPVYVPILHMTVTDAKASMLLENLIGVRDLAMFIFGCKEDETLLTDRRHNWKLNSTVVNPSLGFGFTRFAVDLFTAPDVVKQYLCNVARLHQVPIGSSRSNELYDEIKSAFVNTSYKLYLTDRLEMLSANKPNLDQARAALKETKVVACKEVHEVALRVLQKLEKLRKICVEESFLRLALKSLREELSKVGEKSHDLEHKLQEELTLMEGRLTVFRSAKEHLKIATDHLYEYCGLKTLDARKMTTEEKKIPKMLA